MKQDIERIQISLHKNLIQTRILRLITNAYLSLKKKIKNRKKKTQLFILKFFFFLQRFLCILKEIVYCIFDVNDFQSIFLTFVAFLTLS